jgi:Ras-related protein Rab-7A
VENVFSPEYKATIGADFVTKELIMEGKQVAMQIWDTAGQEKFNSMQGVFYRGSDGCVIVFDTTNPESFEAVWKWKEEFINKAALENAATFPFVLLGNKTDLSANRKVMIAVTPLQVPAAKAVQASKENGIAYYETSAKSALHVKEAFEELALEVIKQPKHQMQATLIYLSRQFNSVSKYAAVHRLAPEAQTAPSRCPC